jgi:hypothetical protein
MPPEPAFEPLASSSRRAARNATSTGNNRRKTGDLPVAVRHLGPENPGMDDETDYDDWILAIAHEVIDDGSRMSAPACRMLIAELVRILEDRSNGGPS